MAQTKNESCITRARCGRCAKCSCTPPTLFLSPSLSLSFLHVTRLLIDVALVYFTHFAQLLSIPAARHCHHFLFLIILGPPFLMQQLLPETDSVMEVILRPAFAIAFATTTTVMLAGNYVMEKSSIEKTSAPARLVHPDLYINVLSNAFFLSIMTFANSYQVTRTVATGASPPIKASRLERMWFPLNVICGRHGDRSMASFVIQMVCFAGFGTLAALHVISFVVNGPENAMNWVMPLHTYMGCCMLWKLSITATIFTLNYIAAHNPTQSIFIPTQDSDAVAPNEEPAVAQQRSSEKKNQ